MNIINFIEKSVNAYFACMPRPRPAASATENVCLIAHRGAHDVDLVENTDAAFAKALDLGCWGIEFDVHATVDQVLVVNHDPTLERLWHQPQAINDLTFAQVRKLAPKIPSLSEVVERYGKRMHLFIELKAPFHSEPALMAVLQTLTPCQDYHLLTLDEAVFAGLSQFPRQALLLVAEHMNVKQFCSLSVDKGYGGVLGHYLLFTNKTLNRLRGADQKTGLGFIDSRYSLYRELNRGLPWLFTNNAAGVCTLLKELQETEATRIAR
ncbi:glycerophosphodiester phosphodiesterase [Legionella dresdenensis]|uniref:Glycerophosphodiester phosphodiesterase n=1 Tax=Legionella dresdenensis TaxID=450200 RepID=A0ABV8CDS8_9GAMM